MYLLQYDINRTCSSVPHNAFFRNHQANSLINDNMSELIEHLWEWRLKIAHWECFNTPQLFHFSVHISLQRSSSLLSKASDFVFQSQTKFEDADFPAVSTSIYSDRDRAEFARRGHDLDPTHVSHITTVSAKWISLLSLLIVVCVN